MKECYAYTHTTHNSTSNITYWHIYLNKFLTNQNNMWWQTFCTYNSTLCCCYCWCLLHRHSAPQGLLIAIFFLSTSICLTFSSSCHFSQSTSKQASTYMCVRRFFSIMRKKCVYGEEEREREMKSTRRAKCRVKFMRKKLNFLKQT